MKFWRNAAALLTVFHPKTTHTGNHSTPKDVKNEGRPGYVYENKVAMDKMPEIISAICARLKPFLQKIGVRSAAKTQSAPRPPLPPRPDGSSVDPNLAAAALVFTACRHGPTAHCPGRWESASEHSLSGSASCGGAKTDARGAS